MYNDHNIFIFDYDFDYNIIESHWREHEDGFVEYTDPRLDGNIDHWQIARMQRFDYLREIGDLFKIKNGRPRFYHLKANTTIPMHKDYNTTCSLNIDLSVDPAPINFEDKSYTYKTAILNTTNVHGVVNGPNERRTLKVSIFDQTYEEVCNNIKGVLNAASKK